MSSTATQLPPEQPPEPLAALPKPAQAKPFTRLIAIDALRGLALVLMSLDHSAYYISANVQAEHYGDHPTILPSWGYRILGLLTNVSAPTFWLVAGISIALLARNLRRRGGGEWAVTRFLWIRADFGSLRSHDRALSSKHPIPGYEYGSVCCQLRGQHDDPERAAPSTSLSLAISIAPLVLYGGSEHVRSRCSTTGVGLRAFMTYAIETRRGSPLLSDSRLVRSRGRGYVRGKRYRSKVGGPAPGSRWGSRSSRRGS
jgi:hypothetical protein